MVKFLCLKANGYKTKLPFVATLDRSVDPGPQKRHVVLRYKKLVDGKVKSVEEFGRVKVRSSLFYYFF